MRYNLILRHIHYMYMYTQLYLIVVKKTTPFRVQLGTLWMQETWKKGELYIYSICCTEREREGENTYLPLQYCHHDGALWPPVYQYKDRVWPGAATLRASTDPWRTITSQTNTLTQIQDDKESYRDEERERGASSGRHYGLKHAIINGGRGYPDTPFHLKVLFLVTK